MPLQTGEILLSVPTLQMEWMGRVSYAEGLELQNALVRELGKPDTHAIGTVLLLEHDPVYTIGRLPDKSSLGNTGSLPHPLVEISRGGQATYHGPGQLVGYPVLDLRHYVQDLHVYLRTLEEAIIQFARSLGVPAERRENFTGVWVGSRKLASIGVGVRQWITMHGFALNVCGSLDGFAAITPCGISGVEMTSLEREGAGLTVREAAEKMAPILRDTLAQMR